MKVLLAVVALFAAFAAASHVVTLADTAAFNAAIAAHSPILVEFFAPWCENCKDFAPNFEKASDLLAGTATLASVDGTKNRDLLLRFSIDYYPCVLLFVNGEFVIEYKGDRSPQDIVSFMKKNAGTAAAVAPAVAAASLFKKADPVVTKVHYLRTGGDQSTSITVGDLLYVSLEGTPTTGYAWKLDSNYDNNLIKLVNKLSQDIPPDNFQFNFTAAYGGDTVLNFGYMHAWSTGPAVQSASLSVHVDDAQALHRAASVSGLSLSGWNLVALGTVCIVVGALIGVAISHGLRRLQSAPQTVPADQPYVAL